MRRARCRLIGRTGPASSSAHDQPVETTEPRPALVSVLSGYAFVSPPRDAEAGEAQSGSVKLHEH